MTHAYLSPSSSERWLVCTKAPITEKDYPDQFSLFAAEGTLAHELAEKALSLQLKADLIAGDYPKEMRKHVQEYLDYVNAIPGRLFVEQKLGLAPVVDNGFGTADAIVINDKELHIIDLKYGKGVPVKAEGNSQLMLYAVGAFLAYDSVHGPFETFHVHIVQPRTNGTNSWTMDFDHLAKFMEHASKRAELAAAGLGDFVPGEHCRWCKAKKDCKAKQDEAVNELLNG